MAQGWEGALASLAGLSLRYAGACALGPSIPAEPVRDHARPVVHRIV